MFRTTLIELAARKARLVATALAIVLGVGFVAGVLIFSDTARAAMFDTFARSARNVDVAVSAPQPVTELQRRQPPVLAVSTLDAVRSVPGVAGAQGRIEENLPMLDRAGRLVGGAQNPGATMAVGTDPALYPFDVTSGRIPTVAGEAALDTDTAARLHYAVGDGVTVLDQAQQRHTLTVVGLVGFGTAKQYSGRSVLVLTGPDVTAFTGATGYQQIMVRAASGVSPAELVHRVRTAVPASATVSTGDAYRLDAANRTMNQASAFLTVLLIFAVIACVVSAFVIYNTFNILVAQRMRQLALLRCVGASRRQVVGSEALEAVAVGLVGAAIGVALGVLVALGMFSGMNALGSPLPSHAIVLKPLPVLVGVAVGVGVSVLSALVPAFRATRVAPLAALRSTPQARVGNRRTRWIVVAVATLAAVLGTLLTIVGSRTDDPQRATLIVVAGGMINFLAVLLLAPLFVGPVTAAVGWLPGRLLGTTAQLASANARRNPGRAAATTAALMVGVGLMAAATVAVTTVKVTATAQINSHYPVDFVLMAVDTGQRTAGIPTALAAELRTRPELGVVAQERTRGATIDGAATTVGAMDPQGLAALPKPAVKAGSWSGLRTGTAVVFDGTGATRRRHVGDHIRIAVPGGHAADLTVAAVVPGTSNLGDVTVSWDQYRQLWPVDVDDRVMVRAADGVGAARSRLVVEQVASAYPIVTVGSIAEFRAQITSAVNQLIAVVAALLAFAIIIALIGIMNTLSLSVLERTRESALTRALGLTRGQLRATLLIEALLMAIVGAVVGVAFGVLYGWATARVMFAGINAIITVPVGQLLGYVAVAAAAGLLAAALPARRAARSSIVAAMADS